MAGMMNKAMKKTVKETDKKTGKVSRQPLSGDLNKQKRSLRGQVRQRFEQWFANRMPRADEATLSIRNVYIFFSREGLLFALLLVITFIAGVNYANNLVLGVCFYLVSMWLISVYLTFSHVSGLKVRLLEVSMSAVGEPVWVTLQIDSESGRPRRQLSVGFDHRHIIEAMTGE